MQNKLVNDEPTNFHFGGQPSDVEFILREHNNIFRQQSFWWNVEKGVDPAEDDVEWDSEEDFTCAQLANKNFERKTKDIEHDGWL